MTIVALTCSGCNQRAGMPLCLAISQSQTNLLHSNSKTHKSYVTTQYSQLSKPSSSVSFNHITSCITTCILSTSTTWQLTQQTFPDHINYWSDS